MKTCITCKIERAVEDYYTKKNECKKCHNERAKAHRRNNKDYDTNKHLVKFYGITFEQYRAMSDAQGNRCAICKRHEETFQKALSVDHNHACCPGKKSCGKCIRALLCVPCNWALGYFQDDRKSISSALSYLDAHSPAQD